MTKKGLAKYVRPFSITQEFLFRQKDDVSCLLERTHPCEIAKRGLDDLRLAYRKTSGQFPATLQEVLSDAFLVEKHEIMETGQAEVLVPSFEFFSVDKLPALRVPLS